MIVTRFNGSTRAFLVQEVDGIIRLAWSEIGETHSNTVTAMGQLADVRALLINDVEKVIHEVLSSSSDVIEATDMADQNKGKIVFYADDSLVARTPIERILGKMGITPQSAGNGPGPLDALRKKVDAEDESGRRLSGAVGALITGVEMPKLDGYVLTAKV